MVDILLGDAHNPLRASTIKRGLEVKVKYEHSRSIDPADIAAEYEGIGEIGRAADRIHEKGSRLIAEPKTREEGRTLLRKAQQMYLKAGDIDGALKTLYRTFTVMERMRE